VADGTGEQNTLAFMSHIFVGGALANNVTNTSRLRSALPSTMNNDQIVIDMFCDGAGEAAIRLASNVNGNTIEFMQEGCRRQTQVTLHGGALHDMQHSTANPNAHHNNNRLFALGSVSNQPSAGMVDRLNPDYSSLSSDFLSTSHLGATLAQQMIRSALPSVPSNALNANPSQTTTFNSKSKQKPNSTTKAKTWSLPISLSSDALSLSGDDSDSSVEDASTTFEIHGFTWPR